MKNKIFILAIIVTILILIGLLLTGNLKTDVLKTGAEKSLTTLVKDKNLTKETTDTYTLTGDNENSLVIQKDFKNRQDINLVLDAKPFIDAGLKISGLPTGYKVGNGKLIISTDFKEATNDSFVDGFMNAIDNKRSALSYHKDLDHYGISLIDNHKFEYAKDYTTNDKDIVFVLSADKFKTLGVDVKNIDGWIYKEMPAEDKTVFNALLKPYDL